MAPLITVQMVSMPTLPYAMPIINVLMVINSLISSALMTSCSMEKFATMPKMSRARLSNMTLLHIPVNILLRITPTLKVLDNKMLSSNAKTDSSFVSIAPPMANQLKTNAFLKMRANRIRSVAHQQIILLTSNPNVMVNKPVPTMEQTRLPVTHVKVSLNILLLNTLVSKTNSVNY